MDINMINCEISCKIIQMNLSSSMLGVSVTDTQYRHAHHTSLLHHSWQRTNSHPAVGSVPSSWDSGTGDRGWGGDVWGVTASAVPMTCRKLECWNFEHLLLLELGSCLIPST